MKAKILTIAGIVHLTVAALLALTFLFGQPVAVSGSTLGFTSTPLPPDTPVPPDTPTPSGTPIPNAPTPAPSDPTGPTPHLVIIKSASPTEVLPGGQVIFTIQVCNEGDGTAASVIVSDALPPELTLVSASASQGQVVVEGNGMRAELGALLPGECASVTIVAQVRADVAPGTVIRNVGSVGDTYDDATVTVVSLLPESGKIIPLTMTTVLLLVGVSLLLVGVVLRGRSD
ncbi:MAG: hypothetical protein DRI77_12560 [Chloroflexi bacterium]|nr:MAG: hypothetical protein DRI77_12560 [Chloroflexota bacterium]